jgi:hypothetical protein
MRTICIAAVMSLIAVCSAYAVDLVKLQEGCEGANAVSAKYPYVASQMSEANLVQYYCILLKAPDDFPPASPGRIACAKQAQYLTREMIRRDLPLLSVCN